MSLPVFWASSCSNYFNKIAHNSFVNFKVVEHKVNYLVRRHVAPGKEIQRSLNGKGSSDLFGATSGFCDKIEKICDNSDPENWIFRSHILLSAINIVTDPSEIRQDTSPVLGNIQGTNGISSGTNKSDMSTVINCSGISSSQNTIPISTTNADLVFTTSLLLSAKYCFGSKLDTGTNMVDPKLETIK